MEVVNNTASVQALVFGAFAAGGFVVKMFDKHVVSSEKLIKYCEECLDGIRKIINELTPRECDEIRALAMKGK